MKLFNLEGPPPGFEDVSIPVVQPGIPEDLKEEFKEFEEGFDQFEKGAAGEEDFDPTAVSATDGSLQQELAYAM